MTLDPKLHARKLQTMIRSAGDFISPSDELRAATLERAIETSKDRTARKRFSQITVALAISMVLISPLVYQASKMRLPTRPSKSEIESAATFEAFHSSTDPAWTMVKLFSEMRHTQSDPNRRLDD